MNVSFEIDDKYEEVEINVYAKAMTPAIQEILTICSKESQETPLFGYKDEQIIPIKESEVIRFFTSDKKIFCHVGNEEVLIKEPLYKLEERFVKMIRISSGEIINPDYIKNLELSFTGTIKINFKDGSFSHTSRRYMKEFKRRLGI
ncbi:MAG: LytTR family DNA-binding domain-containing protein [Vagococcus sp.]|uniref:LytTR family DNA-binding domain-containing protein n=1 Tax=Vagococcus sp. TaxID=1933889 RepID=UPI002FC5B912